MRRSRSLRLSGSTLFDSAALALLVLDARAQQLDEQEGIDPGLQCGGIDLPLRAGCTQAAQGVGFAGAGIQAEDPRRIDEWGDAVELEVELVFLPKSAPSANRSASK